MDWATAAGFGSISALGIVVIVAFLSLLKQSFAHGEAELAAKTSLAAEIDNKVKAESQRDDAIAGKTKAESERDAAIAQVALLRIELAAVRAENVTAAKDKIDAADADLVAVSHGVLGNNLPATSPTGSTAPKGDTAETAVMPNAGTTSNR